MNENDTFPESNLPPESQPWRRALEARFYELINILNANGQDIQGLNRNAASTLEDLAKQVRELEIQVQRVNDLYNALPVAFQRTASASNFGLSSSSWNTVATITFDPPRKGTFMIDAVASGQLVSASTTTNMEVEVRLLRGTDAGPVTPGLAATPDGIWVNNFISQWGWSGVATDPDHPVSISVQIDPVDPASWGSGTGSFVVLSGSATFIPSL